MKAIKVNKHAKPPEFSTSVEAVNAAVMEIAASARAEAQVKHQVKSMVLYRDDLYYDTEDTDFHNILRGDPFGKGKNKVSSAEMMLNAVVRCATAFVQDRLFTDDEKRSFANNAFDLANKPSVVTVASLSPAIRLLKSKEGVDVSIPLGQLGLQPDTMQTRLSQTGQSLRNPDVVEAKARLIVRLLGAEFFQLDQGLDAKFSSADVLKYERQNFKWNQEDFPITDEFKEMLERGIKEVRITSPQLPKAEWPTYTFEGDTAYTSVSDIAQLRSYPNERLAFIKKCIEVRFGNLIGMAVFHLDKGFAQAVAQQDYKEMKLQYVNAWVKGTVETEFGKSKGAADFMTPLTSIREFNRTSRYVGKKKTSDANLLVTRKGDIMFIPETDNIDFVESQVEEECSLANGEWSLQDSIHPESSNYAMRSGLDGIQRKYKKTKGSSRVVYTDWKNSKFCYTDTSGALRVMDLSSTRPADPTHIVNYTRAPIVSMHEMLANALTHASKAPGIVSLPTEEELRQIFPSTGNENALHVLREAAQGAYQTVLNLIFSALDNLHKGNFAGNEITPSPAFQTYLEENFGPLGLQMAEISPTASVEAYRFIGRTMANLLKYAQDDIDRFTAGRSVISALNEMGFASIIVSYGGKGREVVEADRQKRINYVEPDLMPVKDITMTGIPFVKDLKVLPHQVKVWNYLKNAPENAILDVAAGGGKTILALLDVAYFIGKGGKMPLIAMPNNLIKNYINDANLVFKGRMNLIVINGETMKSWGPERLMKLIDAAPINSIFLTSYDFFKSGKDYASYGTVGMEVSANADFMKQFDWGGVWMDESHKLKNEDSQTTRSVMELVAGIPYKRQLTGTYTPDTITDVVAQFGAMNPTVFGDREKFEKTYKDDNNGRGAWKTGSERTVRARMKEFANVVEIRRREWRSLLPEVIEEFWPVPLTENQRKVYTSILEETIERLNELISNDPKLREMMAEQDGNEEIQEALASILHPYMQRLEKFLSSPATDPAGVVLTEDEDRLSPKVKQAYELIRTHLSEGIPGKILIFTQYKATARSLYEMAPPDIKDKIVYYTAGNKIRCMQEFENSPGKIIMVGVETSMNTGLNLQFCSRLIRMETVWNWGNLEQGEARILRPNIQVAEFRENIHFDWVFCDKSVDVTKTSRMIAKLVSTAKFNESEDANFKALPELDMIKLSIESISEMNSWEDGDKGLVKHFNAYQQYRRAETSSFEEFKRNPTNRTEPYKIVDGGIPSNLGKVGMLPQVPYIADMELFGMDELHLQSYSEYMNDHAPEGMLDAVDKLDPTNLKIHTEDGDGVCVGPGTRTIKTIGENGQPKTELVQTNSIRVRMNNGTVVSYSKSNVFVIGKTHTNVRSIREAIGQLAGADTGRPMTLETPPSAVPVQAPKGKKSANERVIEKEAIEKDVKLQLIGYNEYMCIGFDEDDSSQASVKDFAKLGFVPVRPYAYSFIKKWQHLRAWIDAANEKFHIEAKLLEGLEHMVEIWSQSRNNLHLMQQLNAAKLRDFMLKKMKPVVKGEIKPYVMVQDGEVFLCLDKAANATMLARVRAVRVPGVSWDGVEEGEHYKFMRSKDEVRRTVEKIKEQYNITNMGSFTKQFNDIKVINSQPKPK